MFKSKIEVREYAMNKAIELMGTGTPNKQIVEKAKEIESYVIGETVLPEVVDENEMISNIIGCLTGVILETLKRNTSQPSDPLMSFMEMYEKEQSDSPDSDNSAVTAKKK